MSSLTSRGRVLPKKPATRGRLRGTGSLALQHWAPSCQEWARCGPHQALGELGIISRRTSCFHRTEGHLEGSALLPAGHVLVLESIHISQFFWYLRRERGPSLPAPRASKCRWTGWLNCLIQNKAPSIPSKEAGHPSTFLDLMSNMESRHPEGK